MKISILNNNLHNQRGSRLSLGSGVAMADLDEVQALASPPWQHLQELQARSASIFSLIEYRTSVESMGGPRGGLEGYSPLVGA